MVQLLLTHLSELRKLPTELRNREYKFYIANVKCGGFVMDKRWKEMGAEKKKQ
jgi:hypothetical protein